MGCANPTLGLDRKGLVIYPGGRSLNWPFPPPYLPEVSTQLQLIIRREQNPKERRGFPVLGDLTMGMCLPTDLAGARLTDSENTLAR